MATIDQTRRVEPTEKRVVEVTRDGKIVSSEPLDVGTDPMIQRRVEPTVQVIREKRGGSGVLMLFSLLLVLVVAGLGFYIFQTRDDTVAKQQAETELLQQRAAAEQKLQDLGRAADDLSDQVRDAQQDLGVPASPPPATTTTTTTAPVTTTPVQPAPVQPQAPTQ